MGQQLDDSRRSGRVYGSRHRAAVGRLLAAVAAAVVASPGARAAVYVFDPGGQNPPAGASDGSGNFDPTTADFFNVSSGLVGPFGNTAGDTAIFGSGGTGGTVTVGTVNAGTLQFNTVTGSYTLNGGTITLDGGGGVAGTINLSSASGALTPTINSALAGADGLLIQGVNAQNSSLGLSVLTLGGASSYTGVTNISGGVAVSVSSLAAGGNFGNTTGIVLNGTVGTLPTTSGTVIGTAGLTNEGAELIYTGTGTATTAASVGLTLAGNILNTINVSNPSTVLNFAGPVSVATTGAGGFLNKQGAGTLGFTNAANTFNYLFVSSGAVSLGTGTGAVQADTINSVTNGNSLIVGYTNLAPAGASATNPNVATLNILAGATVNVVGFGASLANSNLSSSATAPNNELFVLNVAGTLTNNNTFSDFSGPLGTGYTSVINVPVGGVLTATNVKFNTAALTATSTNTGTTVLNVSGGAFSVTAPGGSASDSLVRQAGGPVLVNLTAGQINMGGTVLITNTAAFNASVAAVSTITQSGGTFGVAGNLGFSTGVGIYNLSGGTLVVNSVTTGGTPAAGSGFIFNGGTLQANASSGTFFAAPTGTGLLGTQIGAGGGTINTVAFNDVTAQNFSSGVTTGTDGGLTKAGAGTLTMTGTSTYTGTTTITGGKLAVNGSLAGPVAVTAGALDGTGKVGAVTVAAGGVIDNGNGSTGTLTLGALTFLGAATDNVSVIGSTPTTPGQIVTGALITPTGGAVQLNLSGGSFSLGTYDLIQYGTLTGGAGLAGFTLNQSSLTLGNNQTATLGTSTSGGVNDIVLTITGAIDQFTGVNGTDFSTNGTTNFRSTTTATAINFANGDAVLFDDSAAAGSTALNLGSAVNPSSTTFNNSSRVYSISSTGGFGIGGTGALVKNGTAALTINTANTYTGGTTLNAGTLNVGNPVALSTGPLTINGGTIDNSSGATLQLSNSAIAINNSFAFGGSAQLNSGAGAVTLSNNPTITVNGTGQLFFTSALSGTSSLTLAGTGTTTLQVISQFNSSNGTTPDLGTQVSSGTLNLKAFFAPGVTNTNNAGGGTGLLLGPVNISSGAVVNANFVNALGYSPAKGVVTTLTVNGTFNDYVDNSQGLFTSVVLGGGSILEQDAVAGGAPGNFVFNANASSGSQTSITTTAGSARSTFTMGVNVANGGTLPIIAGSDLLITGPISQGTGVGSISKSGNGTLTVQDGYAVANSYAGGTTIVGGTVRINELTATPTTLLGTGTTMIMSGGTLGGNGSTGGPVVVAGTITAGVDAATTGTLTTGTETWNGSGGYVAKIIGASNDMLFLSGLTINSSSGGAVHGVPQRLVGGRPDDRRDGPGHRQQRLGRLHPGVDRGQRPGAVDDGRVGAQRHLGPTGGDRRRWCR